MGADRSVNLVDSSSPCALERPETGAMKICIVAIEGPDTVGGLATYGSRLAAGLSEEHEVFYVSRFNRKLPFALDHGEAESPQEIRMGCVTRRTIAPQVVYRPMLRRLLHLLTRDWLRPTGIWIYLAAYLPALRRAIPKDVNVVHFIGTGWDMLGFAALQVARERGAVFTIWPAVHPGQWGDGPTDIQLYPQVDALFAQSRFEKQHLVEKGVDADRISVCALAPNVALSGDGDRFRHRHALGQRPIVLFVGAKSRAKGYHALRAAMPGILQGVPDCCLVTIGPDVDPDVPPVPANAMLDLSVCPESDKADAMAACNVLCMPSAGESFGIVYTEAWSYGKPVIVGPAPASRELVTHGVNGLHVSQSPDDVAAAVIQILSDEALARRLGAAGQAFQRASLTWELVKRRHANVFATCRAHCPGAAGSRGES